MKELSKIGVWWQRQPEKKLLAELRANKQAVASLLVYLKGTEVGSREGAMEVARKQSERSDQEEKKQLGNSQSVFMFWNQEGQVA